MTVAEHPVVSDHVCMKYSTFTVAFAFLALSASAVDRSEVDDRIRKLTMKLDALQSKSDKGIPAERLHNAQGIILLDRTKAGFLFAYQGGHGLVLVRDAKTQRWSPPAFLSANEASLGFQIGGQQSFVVILLMNTNAVQMAAEGSFKFGGEARGTAGNTSSGTEGTVSTGEPFTLVYTDTGGLYGGAAIKGDAISPDTDADLAYYGQYLTMKEILFDGKGKSTPAADDLAKKLDSFAKK